MDDKRYQAQVELTSPLQIFTPVVTTFTILYIVGYATISHAPEFSKNVLGLSAAGLMQGKVWQLFTYSVLNGFWWNLLVDGSIMLFMGSLLEKRWGGRTLVMLWLLSSLFCGILWVAVNFIFGLGYIAAEGTPFAYALVAAFGVEFRKQKMHFYFSTVEAQFVAMFVIGVMLVLSIANPIYLILVGGGALFGYLFVKFRHKGGLSMFLRPKVREHAVRTKGFVDLD